MVKQIFFRIFIVLLSFSLMTAAFSAEKQHQHSAPHLSLNHQLTKQLSVTLDQIRKLYVLEKKDDELIDSALHGLVAGLDPHSVYLNKEELQGFIAQSNGSFSGIGVEVVPDKGVLKVVSPLPGGPADKAGLKSGDYIVAVDNQTLVGMTLRQATNRIRGRSGSALSITVVRPGKRKPKNIQLKREKLHVDPVQGRLLLNRFAYLRIARFEKNTVKQAKSIFQKLQKKANGHLSGVVIDVRNNPGGLLDSAVEFSDLFLDAETLKNNKKIVSVSGRSKEKNQYFSAKPGDIAHGLPIAVLINQGSASASEVVAGALQDHKRAVVVGEQSFGKGSVQTLLPLPQGSAIKLTTAFYYLPKGRSIQGLGIKPDIIVEDFKLKKSHQDAYQFLALRESGMQGSLKNKNQNSLIKVNASSKKQEIALKKLAQEDYQLYQAVQILNALSIRQ